MQWVVRTICPTLILALLCYHNVHIKDKVAFYHEGLKNLALLLIIYIVILKDIRTRVPEIARVTFLEWLIFFNMLSMAVGPLMADLFESFMSDDKTSKHILRRVIGLLCLGIMFFILLYQTIKSQYFLQRTPPVQKKIEAQKAVIGWKRL